MSGIAVALFTYTLWRSTALMWEESRKQLRLSDRALNHTMSVDVTTGRAYVSCKVFSPPAQRSAPGENLIIDWQILANWENTGRTPAINARFYSFAPESREDDLPLNFRPVPIPNDKPETFTIGAGQITAGGVTKIKIDDLITWSRKETRIFIFFRIEYRDVFTGTPTRICQQAYEMIYGEPYALTAQPIPPGAQLRITFAGESRLTVFS